MCLSGRTEREMRTPKMKRILIISVLKRDAIPDIGE